MTSHIIEELLDAQNINYSHFHAKTKSRKNILDVAGDIIPDDPLECSTEGEESYYDLADDAMTLDLMNQSEKYKNYCRKDRNRIFKLALSFGVSPFECTNQNRKKYILDSYFPSFKFLCLHQIRSNKINIDSLPPPFSRVKVKVKWPCNTQK